MQSFEENSATSSIISWINSNWNADLEPDNLTEIIEFCLLWNLFEAIVSRNPDLGKLNSTVDEQFLLNGLPLNLHNELVFFRNRYVLADNAQQKLRELVQKNSSIKKAIKLGLRDDAVLASAVKAMLLICYRIRNNLFHGNKGLWELPKQAGLFQCVNSVLKKYIDNLSVVQKAKALPADK